MTANTLPAAKTLEDKSIAHKNGTPTEHRTLEAMRATAYASTLNAVQWRKLQEMKTSEVIQCLRYVWKKRGAFLRETADDRDKRATRVRTRIPDPPTRVRTL
jgi:hypothetical protein